MNQSKHTKLAHARSIPIKTPLPWWLEEQNLVIPDKALVIMMPGKTEPEEVNREVSRHEKG